MSRLLAVKKQKPEMVKAPQSLEVTELDDATFEATITAKPEPTVEW